MTEKVVNLSEHQAVKQHRIDKQTRRAEQALLEASKQFRLLYDLKHQND